MSTKITILGQESKDGKKPIEFVKMMTGRIWQKELIETAEKPNRFKNIELIAKAVSHNYYDIMFAYNDDRVCGVIFLGHFNDGVV